MTFLTTQMEEISIPPQKLASSLVSDSSVQRQDPDKMAEPVADLENPSVLHQDHPVFQENGLPVQKEEVTTGKDQFQSSRLASCLP